MSLNHIPSTRSDQCVVQPDIRCTHEEADTRILLHASIARTSPILLHSTDSDVLTLAMYVCLVYPHAAYVQSTGRQSMVLPQCYIHITFSGSSSMSWPPSRHSFFGCDSASQFLDHGKKTWYEMFQRKLHISPPLDSTWRSFYCVRYNTSWTGESNVYTLQLLLIQQH